MILGLYPCCGNRLSLERSADPSYLSAPCPHCGTKLWYQLGPHPEAWTEAEFLRLHDVDATGMVTTKGVP